MTNWRKFVFLHTCYYFIWSIASIKCIRYQRFLRINSVLKLASVEIRRNSSSTEKLVPLSYFTMCFYVLRLIICLSNKNKKSLTVWHEIFSKISESVKNINADGDRISPWEKFRQFVASNKLNVLSQICRRWSPN